MKPLSEDELETILDNHATLYSRTTKQYITGEISEEERDKEWSRSDLKTKMLILEDRKAWGEQEHRAGYVRGVNDFSGWYMDASIPAQRILIMPDIAKDLIDNYTPPVYKKQMFVSQRNQEEGK